MQNIKANALISLLCILMLVVVGCDSQKNIESHLAKARQYEKDNNYQAAIIELKNVLQKDPDHQQARTMLGLIYVTFGDGVSAEKELMKAQSLGVPDDTVAIPLMKALLLQGKSEEALGQMKFNENWPAEKKSDMMVLNGDAFLVQGNKTQALSSFQKAIELNPKNSAATIGLAKVSLVDGKPEQAENLLSTIGDEDENAVDMLVLKAKMATRQQKLEDAEKLYEKALKISRQRNQINQSLDVQSQLAMVQISENKTGAALDNVNQLLKAAPYSLIAIYLRGLIAYKQHDYDVVLENLQRVVAKVPEHLPSLLLLGATNYVKGNYEQANNYLTTFVNKVPTHLHARKLLGVIRLRLNKPDEAMEVLKSASESQKKDDAQLLAIIGQAASAGGDVNLGVDYLKRAKKVQPESSEIRSELARVYLSQGAYDKAIQELESITGDADKEKKAKVLLVYTYLRKEDFNQARITAKALVDESPQNPAMRVVLGGVEMIAGNRDEARKHFNEALNIKSDFVLARLNLARMEYEDGKLNEASNQFDAILANDSKNISALLGMAQIAEQFGDTNQALQWLDKARQASKKAVVPRLVLGRYYFRTGKYDQALAVSREAAEVNKNSVEILRLVAASLIKLNRVEEAQNTYQRVIESDPKNPQWYYELANIYSGMQRYNQAIQSLKKALTLDKDFLPAKANLAGINIQQDNLDDALKMAAQIKKEHPHSSAGYLITGDVYVKQNKLKEAQQSYIHGFEIEPNQLLVNKIFLLSNALKNYETSIDVSNQWLKKNPNDTASRMYVGLAYQAISKFDQAEKEYSMVLELQPKNIMALNNMAYLLTSVDVKRALQYAQQANELAPENYAIMDTYGWVLTQSGNIKDGIQVLQKALEKSNGNPSVSYHYAAALVKNSEKSKAASILQEITEAGRQFPELAEAQQLLKEIQ